MFWLEIHDTLPDHPKVSALAAALKLDKDAVTGKLIRLWVWTVNNRENGFYASSDIESIADAMRFKGKASRLVDAMLAARLLDEADGGYRIHEWDEHVGMLLDRRQAARENTRQRVAAHRERKKAEASSRNALCNASVTRYNSVTDGVTDSVTAPLCNVLCNADVTPRVTPHVTPLNQNQTITNIVTVDDDEARARLEVNAAFFAAIGRKAIPAEVSLIVEERSRAGSSAELTAHAINLAAECGASAPARYAAACLRAWYKAGISTVQEAEARAESRAQQQAAKPPRRSEQTPDALKFSQRNYAPGELDALFDHDLEAIYGNA